MSVSQFLSSHDCLTETEVSPEATVPGHSTITVTWISEGNQCLATAFMQQDGMSPGCVVTVDN